MLDHVTPEMARLPRGDLRTGRPPSSACKDAEEAIRLANQTEFGLGAALVDRATSTAHASLARGIEAGAVFVNGLVASDPRLPFGGIKKSGYGRELGDFGIREFVNVKTVWIGPVQ